MRLLILASPFDRVADAVAAKVAAAGGAVQRRSLEELAAARWHHRLGSAGVATDVTFADGSSIAAIAPEVVLNRLRYEPTLLFARMTVADRDYARAEFRALLLSWLASLGERVIGSPTPSGLGGIVLGQWQWLAAAAAAGFATFPAAATTSARRAPPPMAHVEWPALLPGADDPALDTLGFDRPRAHAPQPVAYRELAIVGNRVVEARDPIEADAALRLARAVAADILVLQLARRADDPLWRFVSATSVPETLGDAALDALAALAGQRR